MKCDIYQHSAQQDWPKALFAQPNDPSTLVILFGSSYLKDSPEPVEKIRQHFDKSCVIGCSTAGEIFNDCVSDESISAAIIHFENTQLKEVAISLEDYPESFAAGKFIAKQLLDTSLKHIFLLSDGLAVNGTELMNGMRTILPRTVGVTGGLAGDGDRFSTTWTLASKHSIQAKQIVAVGLYGEHIRVAYGSRGGWDTFGPERVITRAVKNKLYEIDGRPALVLYKEYLGEKAKELPASALLFPLSIRQDENDIHQIVRTVLSVDEKDNSMTFAGNMPEGWLAQLMTANFDRLIEGASIAAQLSNLPTNTNILSIAISCVGRRLVLGERTEEETTAVLENLPKKTKQIGFYSYGEICPIGVINCRLHNQTMTLTAIYEV